MFGPLNQSWRPETGSFQNRAQLQTFGPSMGLFQDHKKKKNLRNAVVILVVGVIGINLIGRV